MARNTKCYTGYKRYKWDKIGRCQATQASLAIDELGRLFAWGQNSVGQCGQGDPNIYDDRWEFEYCTQIGDKQDWIGVGGGELSMMAINRSGELWGWGYAGYRQSAFGLPDAAEDNYWFPVRCAPNNLFKAVAHQYYATIAIGTDNKLYSFGSNIDYCLGIGGVQGNNYNTPQLNPYITEDIKLIDSELFCTAVVTVTNRVYLFGCDWWYTHTAWDGYYTGVPWEVTGLPVGSNITQVSVCQTGVVVLLDDGTVWKAGNDGLLLDGTSYYVSGSVTFEQVVSLSAYTITKISHTALGAFSFFVISDEGNIYGYSESGWASWVGNSSTPVINTPNLIAAEYEGNVKFVDVCPNEHQNVWYAIDDQGYLWTWGTQTWGSHLAIGKKSPTSNGIKDSDDYEVVKIRAYAGLAEPAVDYKGDPAYLNNKGSGESDYLPYIPQVYEHRPCGHWHVRLFEEEVEYPRNCWMPTIAVKDGKLLFVAAGRHLHDDPTTGTEVFMMLHNIGANTWETLLWSNLKWTSEYPGGADLDSDIYAFMNYKVDVSGTQFNEVYTNPAMGVWVVDNSGTLNYTDFADSTERSGRDKIGAYAGGVVAIAYEDGAGQLLVKVSTDYGATWNLRNTIGASAARKDWSLIIDPNGYIYLAYQASSSTYTVIRSVDNGLNWTTQKAGQSTLSSMTAIRLNEDGGRLFTICQSATKVRIQQSINAGVTWTTASGISDQSLPSVVGHGTFTTENSLLVAYNGMNIYYNDPVYGTFNWSTVDVGGYTITGVTASMDGDSGIVGYSAWGFHAPTTGYVIIGLSMNGGAIWTIRQTPLQYFANVDEITDFRGNPLFYLTDSPHLNPEWNFVRDDWAETFIKQEDKY